MCLCVFVSVLWSMRRTDWRQIPFLMFSLDLEKGRGWICRHGKSAVETSSRGFSVTAQCRLRALDQSFSKGAARASGAVVTQFPGLLVICVNFIYFHLTEDIKHLMYFCLVRYHMLSITTLAFVIYQTSLWISLLDSLVKSFAHGTICFDILLPHYRESQKYGMIILW